MDQKSAKNELPLLLELTSYQLVYNLLVASCAGLLLCDALAGGTHSSTRATPKKCHLDFFEILKTGITNVSLDTLKVTIITFKAVLHLSCHCSETW